MDSSSQHANQHEIDTNDSLLLMGRQSIGRLVIADPHPSVRPLNFVLVDRQLFVRTDAPPADGVEVAFEVDQIDAVNQQGWSVVARGRATSITADAVPERVIEVLRPWAPGPKDSWTVINIDAVTGRWVQAQQPVEVPDARGYL